MEDVLQLGKMGQCHCVHLGGGGGRNIPTTHSTSESKHAFQVGWSEDVIAKHQFAEPRSILLQAVKHWGLDEVGMHPWGSEAPLVHSLPRSA